MNKEHLKAVGVASRSSIAVAWDTCHKIYFIRDERELARMTEYGYRIETSDYSEYLKNLALAWYEASCALRFIDIINAAADDSTEFVTVIEQGF